MNTGILNDIFNLIIRSSLKIYSQSHICLLAAIVCQRGELSSDSNYIKHVLTFKNVKNLDINKCTYWLLITQHSESQIFHHHHHLYKKNFHQSVQSCGFHSHINWSYQRYVNIEQQNVLIIFSSRLSVYVTEKLD